jgi:hypothetical protein
MINNIETILDLVKNEEMEETDIQKLLENQWLIPYNFCLNYDAYRNNFGRIADNFTQKDYWDGDDYAASVYYYKGTPIVVIDCYDDGEDSWNEDSRTINKELAAEAAREIMKQISNYLVKQILGE